MADETEKLAQIRKLTRAERAVLDVLANPQYFKADHATKMAAADVSRGRYYEIIADPWFKAQTKEAFLEIIHGRVGLIVTAAADTAETLGRDGHPDRKMLLEMSGMYAPKLRSELTGADGGAILFKKAEDLSDDELAVIATSRGPGTSPEAEGS